MSATRILTNEEQKAQGARCGCKGTDDYCVCQNVPDRITQKDWGLTPRGSIPSVFFNLIDLLKDIANPNRDPSMDIADGVTMMDHWRTDAKRLLPMIREGVVVVDEEMGKVLHDASWQAQRLRDLRQEYRSPSANFPTMVKVQYAQDAAATIDSLIQIIRSGKGPSSP